MAVINDYCSSSWIMVILVRISNLNIRMEKALNQDNVREKRDEDERMEEEEEEEDETRCAIEIDNGQFEMENCTVTCDFGSGVLAMNKYELLRVFFFSLIPLTGRS